MLKHVRALGFAGLTTLGANQLTQAIPNNVLWSCNGANTEVVVSGVKHAAQTMGQLNPSIPIVRFTHHTVGGFALVPLLSYENDDRCSPNFDLTPFHAEKGDEVWAHFEFVGIEESDRDLIAFSIKADKPGRKSRFRANNDIGLGHLGNKPAMSAMIAPPSEGDLGYYFLNRGILETDELLNRNPGAAIRVVISNHTRGAAS